MSMMKIMHTVMCLSIGTPKIINFPFGTNGKLSILGVPIFKHIRVMLKSEEINNLLRQLTTGKPLCC